MIIADLEEAGYITRHRVGRRNRYVVNAASAFRHPSQDGLQVGPFLDLLAKAGEAHTQDGPAHESRDGHLSSRIHLPRRRGSDPDRCS